jgi:hypothetical protein
MKYGRFGYSSRRRDIVDRRFSVSASTEYGKRGINDPVLFFYRQIRKLLQWNPSLFCVLIAH